MQAYQVGTCQLSARLSFPLLCRNFIVDIELEVSILLLSNGVHLWHSASYVSRINVHQSCHEHGESGTASLSE